MLDSLFSSPYKLVVEDDQLQLDVELLPRTWEDLRNFRRQVQVSWSFDSPERRGGGGRLLNVYINGVQSPSRNPHDQW